MFDEIDQGRAIMKKHSGQHSSAPKEPETGSEAEETDEGTGLLARVQQLIRDYREPDDPQRSADDGIVSCELSHGVTFTHESDCLSRGGVVL